MSTLTRRTLPTVLAAMSARALVQATEPLHPNIGAIWFDTTVGALKVWDGSAWNIAEVDTTGIADGAVSTAKVDFTAFDIGAIHVTIASAAPSSPATGDVWFDASNGYVMNEWDGTAWQPFQWDSGAIASGSIDTSKVSFTARDLDGITTTFAATAPASPVTGDLWYDSSNGYKLNRWDGTQWVAVQYGTNAIAAGSITAGLIAAHTITASQIAAGTITTNEIAANTITAADIAAGTITATQLAANSVTASQIAANAVTAAKLAAGIVYAGIVDATTITGAQFVATGSSGEILVYSSSPPTAGNLLLAISGAASADAHGNIFGGGLTLATDNSAATPDIEWVPQATGGTKATVGYLENYLVAGDKQLRIRSANDILLLGSNIRFGSGGPSPGTVNVYADQTNLNPTGAVIMYGAGTAPTGWLKCDGTAVSRTTYANLFAVIGTSYGVGDGSTTFNLPNFTSVFPRGSTPGTTGGSDSHTHPLSDAGQAQVTMTTSNEIALRQVGTGPNFTSNRHATPSSGTDSTSRSTATALQGATDSASHVPTYLGVTFIIKT